jgi:hypothetical protein
VKYMEIVVFAVSVWLFIMKSKSGEFYRVYPSLSCTVFVAIDEDSKQSVKLFDVSQHLTAAGKPQSCSREYMRLVDRRG